MIIIDRKSAFRAGLTRYYTGIPCKQGHLAARYVSSGACLECQNPYKQRRHPTRKDLEPYVCPKLWVPVNTTPEQFAQLESYLAKCIETFFAHVNATPSKEVVYE